MIASAGVAAALALGGCNTDGTFPYASKANVPLSSAMIAEIEQKNMAKESPILVRLFKEEAELEVWKQDRSGRYALLKTYPICRWSGELGPKIKEGDRQAPEGFYTIAPGQMNPNSQYYLSFNLGYPNAYDQAWGRTGSQLMVHGDCSSRGCYAMTDEQISEIFALGRESFFGGQQAFQVQAYPFRMTPQNMARHRNNPNYAFWKMLKRGNDHFEVTRLEPKVDVCEKRYVFDAEQPANSSSALRFSPAGRCPAYAVPQEVADAVNDKQRRDEVQTAQLIARGTPTAPIKTNSDGGMNPVFLAALQREAGRDVNGQVALTTPIRTQLGTIPTHVNPPREPQPQIAETQPASAPVVVANVPVPRAAPQAKIGVPPEEPSFADKLGSLFKPAEPPVRVIASEPLPAPVEEPKPARRGSVFNRMFASKGERPDAPKATAEAPRKDGVDAKISRKLGLRGAETTAAAEEVPLPEPKAAPVKQAPAHGAIRPQVASRDAEPEQPKAAPTAPATTAATGSLLAGAQPIVPTTSFDNRWSGFR
jgi:murein L,D-transpeptidase YafK